ncbi:unnamed protein product [Cladocopium goreaui]|uniref:Uncharacterized protein n=1 Tax=Cladocopium goreaui TaxID=2562237 RepID=A0A9P1DQJ2_9DINO|nr:unnamed protein product [Cladocopium goreaui]CAI4014619.1 unnamed protein product [Cladocopium goreaui]
MKWDGVPGNLGHIIPTVKVNSDLWTSDTNKIKDLQRLNGDSELAAALLIAFWFRNDSDICHWLKRELADIVLEFYSYGVGSQFDLAKFGTTLPNLLVGLVEDEERDRQVIGLGAADKRLVLAKMVDGAMTEMALSEDKAIEALLSKGSYMRGWHPGLPIHMS